MSNVPSDSSLDQTRPSSALSAPTPVTPAGTTDDSDTDFQSAYSTSPRASYMEDKDDEVFTTENDLEDNFDTDSAPSFSKTRRERVSSTATAINNGEHTKTSPTFSVDTLTSRGRGQR
jgi:nicotinamide N-methyltransferase